MSSGTQILLRGVDTLVRTFLAPVPAATLERLHAAKEEARQRRELGHADAVQLELGGIRWAVSPSGAPPYRFLLHADGVMDARIAGRPSLAPGTPTVVVEIRSAYLWRRGFTGAADDAQEFARAALGGPAECLESVSRIDLCCDFQGWAPDGSDAESERFARVVTKGWKRNGIGSSFTGYQIAPGQPFSARLYDKTEEIAGTDKEWFRYLWALCPVYDASRPVWRLELQARSEALSELGLRVDWDKQICDRLDELWRYAFGRLEWSPDRETTCERALRQLKQKRARAGKRGAELSVEEEALIASLEVERADEKREFGAWLSLRDPVPGRARTEWPISPDWRAIQGLTFADKGAVRGLRERQRDVKLENLLSQMRGLLSTYAAHSGIRPSAVADRREARARTLSWALAAAHEGLMDLDEHEARDFVARLEEKRLLVPPSPTDEQPKPRPHLPEAPWSPEPDPRRTLPFQAPSMLELRDMPRAETPVEELPVRSWKEVEPAQFELDAATVEWQKAMRRHDAEQDRRYRRRSRFAPPGVHKRLPKVRA